MTIIATGIISGLLFGFLVVELFILDSNDGFAGLLKMMFVQIIFFLVIEYGTFFFSFWEYWQISPDESFAPTITSYVIVPVINRTIHNNMGYNIQGRPMQTGNPCSVLNYPGTLTGEKLYPDIYQMPLKEQY